MSVLRLTTKLTHTHRYLSALDAQPPLIKSTDFDPHIFDRIIISTPQSGLSTPVESTSPGLAAFVDLVCVQGQILESLHGNAPSTGHVEHILSLDHKLESLRAKLGDRTFGLERGINREERARTAGRLLRQIHYNW